MTNSVLKTGLFQQKRSIEALIEESRADGDFYLFLSFAAFITTLGLLLDNAVVIIGAMVVAPILFPLLALGMGVVTSSSEAILRSIGILWRSIGLVVAVSLVTALLVKNAVIGAEESILTNQLELVVNPNYIMFFLVAFFSGVVASYSWVKQEMSSLPGIAITVSLVPPLAAIGIAVSALSQGIFSGALFLFVVNLLGVVLASVVVFSLFGFSSMRKWQDQKIVEETVETITKEAVKLEDQ